MKKSLFWLLIGVSLVLNFIIFKDLADISQWLVQSSRDFTMAVWFNRHIIAAVSLGTLIAAWVVWAGAREICRTGVVVGLTALSLFLFYQRLHQPARDVSLATAHRAVRARR